MIPLFESILAACPDTTGTDNRITVVVDSRPIGKSFALVDGKVSKTSVVAVVEVTAMQFCVRDFDELQSLLQLVSESPHAALTNCGWSPVGVGVPFILRSRKALQAAGLDPDGVHVTDDGLPVFARLKSHALLSVWQMLDRDVDEHTPPWASAYTFDAWRVAMDQLLPGVSGVTALHAPSSSARVLLDGQPVGGGNGHTWIRVEDVADVERTRVAIIARAAEFDKLWEKPRYSRVDGTVVGQSPTTICDPSVWTPGRLVFDGKPNTTEAFTVAPQVFTLYPGVPALDTSRAVVSPLKTLRQTAGRRRTPIIVGGEGKTLHIVEHSLTLKTALELADGSEITVAQALVKGEKLRCQAPFRASSSMAAFFAVDALGAPLVHDSGTGTTYRLAHPKTNKDANTIIAKMVARLKGIGDLALEPEIVPYCINQDVIARAVDHAFWNPDKGKFMVLWGAEGFRRFSAPDAFKFGIKNLFGDFYNRSLLAELITTKDDLDALMASQAKLFLEHIQSHRQADKATMRVDMFATRPSLTFSEGEADVVLCHRPFNELRDIPDDRVRHVWDDFCQHFPEFPAFVEFILQARFCSGTRRRAFLWLHVISDWGKGALVQVLRNLGIIVELSIKEITLAMAGAPSGVDPDELLHAWAIYVDEWKAANGDLKELNDSLAIAAKGRMRVRVPLYTKLFASAENVASLTNGGVEDQFVNRFSYLNPPPALLKQREMVAQMGSTEYIRVLSAGVARYLNVRVPQMVAQGSIAADRQAMTWIDAFHDTHLLTDSFESLSEGLVDMAEQLRAMVRGWYRQRCAGLHVTTPMHLSNALDACKIGYVSGQKVIQLSDRVFEVFRDLSTSHSTRAKFGARDLEMKAATDEGGASTRKYRLLPEPGAKARDHHQTHGAIVFLEEAPLPVWLLPLSGDV